MWMDRIIFQGEAYFIGFDVRRLAQEPVGGFWNGPDHQGFPAPSTYIHPRANSVIIPPPNAWDYRQPRAYVIYKYNRPTNTMILVRSGDQIETALGVVPSSPAYGPQALSTTLATDGYHLFYSHNWRYIDGGSTSPAGPGLHFGAFDGSIWEDSFIDRSIRPGGPWGVVKSMIGHEDGVLVLMGSGLWRFSYGTKVLDPVWEASISGSPSISVHSGLNGRDSWSMDETLFFGPK